MKARFWTTFILREFVVAPNGIMYVKPEVRKGLLGRMLTELLDTRVMVKQAMKRERDNKVGVTEPEILQKTKSSLGTN